MAATPASMEQQTTAQQDGPIHADSRQALSVYPDIVTYLSSFDDGCANLPPRLTYRAAHGVSEVRENRQSEPQRNTQSAQPVPPTANQQSRPRSSLHRIIHKNTSNIPNIATCLASQLNYIETNRVSRLRDHTAVLKRIFLELRHLQFSIPD